MLACCGEQRRLLTRTSEWGGVGLVSLIRFTAQGSQGAGVLVPGCCLGPGVICCRMSPIEARTKQNEFEAYELNIYLYRQNAIEHD